MILAEFASDPKLLLLVSRFVLREDRFKLIRFEKYRVKNVRVYEVGRKA